MQSISEEIKWKIEFLMKYGYFTMALDEISKQEQLNPQNPNLPILIEQLREKIQLSNIAAQESVDQRFYALMDNIASRPENEIFNMLLENFNAAPVEYRQQVAQYCSTFSSHGYGRLDPANGVYDDFHVRAKMLNAHHGDFLWLHNRLADARSKNVLFAILSSWINMENSTTDVYKERVYPEYFDPTVFERTSNEVFVDLGAAYGDTVLEFASAYLGNYKHIYSYEITPSSFEKMEQCLRSVNFDTSKVSLRQKAAWSNPGTMRLSIASGPAANHVSDAGEIEIETVRIDDDITEAITFLKMDIEGAEIEAIKGCRRQIAENRPKLAICTYHGYNDSYAVPRLIDEIAPDGYEMYMRYHGGYYAMPSEFTLLGVPR